MRCGYIRLQEIHEQLNCEVDESRVNIASTSDNAVVQPFTLLEYVSTTEVSAAAIRSTSGIHGDAPCTERYAGSPPILPQDFTRKSRHLTKNYLDEARITLLKIEQSPVSTLETLSKSTQIRSFTG
ncbi:hypothetical protein J6590_103982 [Homalodisca vitripennis]|nr:hypothetical protein J6590_103982 [Homalodisca vitripennis]